MTPVVGWAAISVERGEGPVLPGEFFEGMPKGGSSRRFFPRGLLVYTTCLMGA